MYTTYLLIVDTMMMTIKGGRYLSPSVCRCWCCFWFYVIVGRAMCVEVYMYMYIDRYRYMLRYKYKYMCRYRCKIKNKQTEDV